MLSPAPPPRPFPTASLLGTLQVGEDVPDARKCACASHVAKVAEFFQVRVGPGLVRADQPPRAGSVCRWW